MRVVKMCAKYSSSKKLKSSPNEIVWMIGETGSCFPCFRVLGSAGNRVTACVCAVNVNEGCHCGAKPVVSAGLEQTHISIKWYSLYHLPRCLVPAERAKYRKCCDTQGKLHHFSASDKAHVVPVASMRNHGAVLLCNLGSPQGACKR
jgi:hypothetical protein